MYFHKKEMMYSLKQDACFLIFEKAKALAEKKNKSLFQHISKIFTFIF